MLFFGTQVPAARPQHVPKYAKAAIGGFSGIFATTVVHPLDLVKIRMQLHVRRISMSDVALKILRCEGYKALYAGLTAAFLRQSTYTTSRIAVYHWIYESYTSMYGLPGLSEKVMIGVYASMAGALAGGPSEIALVRMMADGPNDLCGCHLKKPYRRYYRGVFDAIYKIARNEGPKTLWRGGQLSLIRAACVGTVQVGSYTQTRDYLLEHKYAEGIPLHCYTSIVSGFTTAIVTLPVDKIKVRYQVHRDGPTQKQIFFGIYRSGILAFWQGFLPYFVRFSMHTSLTYICMHELTQLYLSYKDS